MSDNIMTIDLYKCTVPLCRNQHNCWYRRNNKCKFRHRVPQLNLQVLPRTIKKGKQFHKCKTLCFLVNGFTKGIMYNDIISIITTYIPKYYHYHLTQVPSKKFNFFCYMNDNNCVKIYINDFEKPVTFNSFSLNNIHNKNNKKYIICNRK